MLKVNHLNKDYGDFKALQDVNFELERGQILGLVGENGAGKSTIIKILSGLIEPSSGEIEYFGQDFFSKQGEIKRRIGYLPEIDSLYENMDPLEYLGFFASLYDITSDKARKKARELTRMLNLPQNKSIGEFSKGMKRKVSIARTLMHDPDILIYDEPTGGLDPSTSLFISEFMKSLKEEGKGILFSAHNMYYVETVCDEIIILKEGRIIYKGTVEALRRSKSYVLYYQTNSKVESFETSDIGELNSFIKSITSSGGKIVKIDSQIARLEDLYFSILKESSS
ncbi:MAG: ABC transporter ATP-binding protein [Halobacteriota archaeon]